MITAERLTEDFLNLKYEKNRPYFARHTSSVFSYEDDEAKVSVIGFITLRLQKKKVPLTSVENRKTTDQTQSTIYLSDLEKIRKRAVIVLTTTALLFVFSFSDIIAFTRTDTNFLHPYLSVLLAVATFFLFFVALLSIDTTTRKIQAEACSILENFRKIY